MARTSTGKKKLDVMMYGGFITGSLNIVHGEPGTGKTTFALEFLREGAEKGENTLFISLDVSAEEIKKDFSTMNINISDVFILDAVPSGGRKEVKPYKELTKVTDAVRIKNLKKVEKQVEVDVLSLKATLKDIFDIREYKRVVIDSVSSLKYFYMRDINSDIGAHSFLRFILTTIGMKGGTILVTFEDFGVCKLSYERYMANSSIELQLNKKTGERFIDIEKMEGTKHSPITAKFKIDENGFNVISPIKERKA